MRFYSIPVSDAEGHILGHNITDSTGRRVLRKGRALSADNITLLKTLNRQTIYIAQLDHNDIREDIAAAQLGKASIGDKLRLSGAATGRINIISDALGVFRVDISRLSQLNNFNGITLATRLTNCDVSAGQMVATLKIIPYAVPNDIVQQAHALISSPNHLLQIAPLTPKRVSLILSGSPAAKSRIVAGYRKSLVPRLAALAATVEKIEYVSLDEVEDELNLAAKITDHVGQGLDMVILAGDTAIMDRHDIAPRAVERAGGTVTCYGAPVDPGNLLMLGYHGDTPILGAPSCARSPKRNIVDIVLPRLLVGDRLTQADIVGLGHGGLLEDVVERPLPRGKLR